MSLDDPVILTCSISGAVANRDQCPAIPYTPEEYAAEARRIVDEGGSMIHIHARTPDGTPSLRDRGLPRDHRGDPGRGRRRGHQLLDGRGRRAGREADRLPARAAARRRRAEHGLDELREVLAQAQGASCSRWCSRTASTRSSRCWTAMNECGIRPEHECFDSGHLANLDPLLDMGALRPPLQVSCVMGVIGGIRPTARNLAHMAEQVPRRAARVGRDRRLARPVDARGGGAVARRQRARRAWRTTSTCPTARWPAPTAT